MFYVHPENCGKDEMNPFWRAYFFRWVGWNHQLGKVLDFGGWKRWDPKWCQLNSARTNIAFEYRRMIMKVSKLLSIVKRFSGVFLSYKWCENVLFFEGEDNGIIQSQIPFPLSNSWDFTPFLRKFSQDLCFAMGQWTRRFQVPKIQVQEILKHVPKIEVQVQDWNGLEIAILWKPLGFSLALKKRCFYHVLSIFLSIYQYI